MKIGVVSDTHRNRECLDSVVNWLVNRHRIAMLYHLGDDYEDVIGISSRGVEIAQVPGIYHTTYRDGSLEPKHLETVLGLRVVLVHSFEKDITAEDKAVSDVILYGHTHRPEIKLEDGLLMMNPGHLKGTKDKNVDPSFGLLDIQERSVSVRIFGMDYKELKSVELVRSENGLYGA